MDTRNFLASKITTELEKFHYRAIHNFPQTTNSIFDTVFDIDHALALYYTCRIDDYSADSIDLTRTPTN